MATIPYVKKERISIVVVGDISEAIAIRSMLEAMNYCVILQHASSRAEFIKLLEGNIATSDTIILSCHGDEEGILFDDEPAVSAKDIIKNAKWDNKTVLSLGCLTGHKDFVDAFLASGVKSYIAPIGYPEGRAALMYASSLFFFIASGNDIDEAALRSMSIDKSFQQFQANF